MKRLGGDDRILYLANALMDEVERQGYDTECHHPTPTGLRSLNIHHYTDRTAANLDVSYINNNWRVRGNRTA